MESQDFESRYMNLMVWMTYDSFSFLGDRHCVHLVCSGIQTCQWSQVCISYDDNGNSSCVQKHLLHRIHGNANKWNNIKMLTDHLNFLIRFSRFEADITCNTNAAVFRFVNCQQVFELHVYSIWWLISDVTMFMATCANLWDRIFLT